MGRCGTASPFGPHWRLWRPLSQRLADAAWGRCLQQSGLRPPLRGAAAGSLPECLQPSLSNRVPPPTALRVMPSASACLRVRGVSNTILVLKPPLMSQPA